jgi:hypothetical protein
MFNGYRVDTCALKYLFHCTTPYIDNNDLFIKLEMVYSDNKTDKIIFVSMGDDKEFIKKYSSPDKFKEYCNPKTNKKIKNLKLYNMHF